MAEVLQRFIANFKGGIRHDTLEGRKYIVAPVVMLVEGVVNGSKGALYYPGSELGKTPVVWDHKPIVVYHPEMNGQAISACSPAVIESRKVGMLLNTKYDTKLRAEAWFEEEKMKKVDPRVYEALEKGEMMEVSTGLFTDNVQKPGKFGDKQYDAVATNYRPDHLAILPDKVGACSIADGAGLLANELTLPEINQMLIDGKTLQPEVIRGIFETLRVVPLYMAQQGNGITTNVISHTDTHRAISKAMEEEHGGKYGYGWNGQVEDVYDNYFIYSKDGKKFKRDYTADHKEHSITMADKKHDTEVVKHSEYRTGTGKTVAPTGKGPKVVSGSQHTINVQGGDPVAEPVTTQPVTTEQYIQNAPADVQEFLQEGLLARNAERDRLIAVITANKANIVPAESLKLMKLNDLRALAVLAAPPVDPKQPVRVPNFLGAGSPPPVANSNGTQQAHLSRPVLNFKPDPAK